MLKYLITGLFLFYGAIHAQTPKLYITIVSHNEDNIGYNNSSTLYYNNRSVLVNICNILQTKGAKYNYGADYVALQAIANLDTGNVVLNTNGKNLVKWMKEDMGVECDPHSHESLYNYADVHYLMSQLYITPSDVMSGYLYDTLQNGNAWDSYQNGVTGTFFTSHTWYPKILWGGATPMHVSDPYFFGVFKPQSRSNFFSHSSSNTLTAIGVGCPLRLDNTTTINYVDSIIGKIVSNIQSGILPPTGFYTQEIFFSELIINQSWFIPFLKEVVDSVNVYVTNGTVEWKNLTEIYNLWNTEYDSIPFAYDCDGYNVLGFDEQSILKDDFISIYPNPTSGQAILHASNPLNEAAFTLNNYLGQTVAQINNLNGQTFTLNFDDLPGGLYLIRILENNRVIATNEIIIKE